MKYFKGFSFYIVLLVVAALGIVVLINQEKVTTEGYSQMINQIEENNVKSIKLQGSKASVVLKEEIEVNSGKLNNFTVYIPDVPIFTAVVSEQVTLKRIADFEASPPPTPAWWVSILPTLGLIVIFILFWVFFLQQSQGGGGNRVMSFGKSRAKLAPDDRKKVTFEDVAGADEEKEELSEIVDFLKLPKKYIELGARIPKGVLLVGPPGTGKTLLAKAVAGEAGVPFFTISGSDFVEMFVGVGASRVRDLFEQAKKHAPCIVFIDEIDAVGRHRGAGLGGGHDEREQTLNQLLVEMDGFGLNEGVIMLAATNRADILDPALLRPGRFDRRVSVGLPDIKGREEILVVHSKDKPLDETVNLKEIAKSTSMFTGADLENLLNEAALLAARKDKKAISMDEVHEATFKVTMGPEKKSRVITEKAKKATAYHEAGHAIVGKIVSSKFKVNRVTIIPVGSALGYVSFRPEEDITGATEDELLQQIKFALGGRAAEEIIFNEIGTGASNDLEKVNGTARNMITKFGMSKNLKNMVFNSGGNDEVFIGRSIGQNRNYSEDVASQIDEDVQTIINKAYEDTLKILNDNIDLLHKIANVLIEKEKIEGPEFYDLFEKADISKDEPSKVELNKEDENTDDVNTDNNKDKA